MIFARTTSSAETKELAAALAELARPGDLVLLAGDLGAGKTAFTQGFGAALGIAMALLSAAAIARGALWAKEILAPG